MGVRGLTTYIAKNAELYLLPHELHDCDLVIDGDNFASQLYKWVSECNSAYGGNYDQYYRTVVNVFQTLDQCGVNSYVILDGGYERKKMKTVQQRLRGKIAAIKKTSPYDSTATFPLFMREVFVDAIKFCNIKLMRCLYEADEEIALLSKKLNCPVLSYDSDFYIHNVKYIPISTVTFKVYKRILDGEQSHIVNVPKIKKKSKRKILVTKEEDDPFQEKKITKLKDKNYYYFLDSCLYEIENITTNLVKLKFEMFPLLAILLGNDYIERKAFAKFYHQVSLKKGGRNISLQQKRIFAILHWLENQTLQGAIKKILGCLTIENRETMKNKIESAMEGYQRENCVSYEYFGFLNNEKVEGKKLVIDIHNIDEEEEFAEVDEVTEAEGEEFIAGEENLDEENLKSDSEGDLIEFDNPNEDVIVFPDWFKKRFMNAEFSRCFVDFLSLKIYVNVPQIENFKFPDSNGISEKILQYIFSLLHLPNNISLTYITRDIKGHNCTRRMLNCMDLNDIVFDPEMPKNILLFKKIFEEFNDCEEIFDAVNLLPKNYQLYFIAIIYWSRKSNYIEPFHIYSVLFSILALNIVDVKCGVHRNVGLFTGSNGKHITETKKIIKKLSKDDFVAVNYIDVTLEMLNETNKNITKDEALFVQEKFIQLFQIGHKSKVKHNDMVFTILHSFAEFQSVVFNLNGLNVLLNYPFDNIKMYNMFNGMFLFNMYENLKGRHDISHFIRYYLFDYSPNIYKYYYLLLEWVKKFVPILNTPNLRRNKRKKKKKKVNEEEEEVYVDETDVADEIDFDDVNNKFSLLLKI